MKRPFERIKALLIILALICFSFSHPALAGSERHSLTFIKKSGKFFGGDAYEKAIIVFNISINEFYIFILCSLW